MMFGMIVPKKGISESWVDVRVSVFINGFGYKKLLFRSDNELSIVALRKKIAAGCHAQVIEEDAIAGESPSNGLAEVGIKIVEGVARTHKIDLEQKIKKEVDNRSILLSWLVEHACTVYNRCAVLQDGRTPWQRAYGKSSSLPLIPFGEKVLFKRLKVSGSHKNSLAPRFEYGIYLGSRSKSGEHFVGVEEGVMRCRDLSRLSEDRRWDIEMIEKIKGTPWAPLGGEMQLEVPTNIPTEKLEPKQVEEYRSDLNIKRMMLRRTDVEKFGPTTGCGGCRAALEGRGRRQNHTEGCRKRMEEELRKEPAGAERVEKNKRRFEEELGREVEKRVKHAEAGESQQPPAGPEIDVKMDGPKYHSQSGTPQFRQQSSPNTTEALQGGGGGQTPQTPPPPPNIQGVQKHFFAFR